MKTNRLFISILFVCTILSTSAFSQKTGQVTLDGKTYSTVQIGKKEWLSSDLEVSNISGVTIHNGSYFYTLEATKKIDTLFADGWRVPRTEDFMDLVDDLGGKNKAKKKLLEGENSLMNMKFNGLRNRPTAKSKFRYTNTTAVYYFAIEPTVKSKRSASGLWMIKTMGVMLKVSPVDAGIYNCNLRLVKDVE